MKVFYCSDIHNCYHDRNALLDITGDKDAVLVVAGDIHHKGRMVRDLEEVAERWKAIVAVPGNHDWWGLALHERHKHYSDVPNVHVLMEDFVTIDDVIFAGTTMWHEVTAETGYMWKNYMNDAKKIRAKGYTRLQGWDIMSEHIKGIKFIEEFKELFRLDERPKVLVTHHALCNLSIDERYKNEQTNAFYVTHLPELLNGFDYHVHGHVHQELDYIVPNGECNVVCNPHGYGSENTHYGLRIFDV